jgi:hypothetical protein
MFIKIRYPLILKSYYDGCFVTCVLSLFLASGVILTFNFQIEDCRTSISLLSRNNTMLNGSFSQCNISYEECRCSVISNKSNNPIECITDLQATIAHISPLVSYMLHLYVIYELFSFTGKYSHILKDIFWVIALFVFIIIAIVARGSTCLYYNTSEFLFKSSLFLFTIFVCLFIASDIKDRVGAVAETHQERRSAKNKHRRDVIIIVIMS